MKQNLMFSDSTRVTIISPTVVEYVNTVLLLNSITNRRKNHCKLVTFAPTYISRTIQVLRK